MKFSNILSIKTVLTAALVMLFVCFSALLQADEDSKWWQGGSLHEATISQWQEASSANKLATASDWLSATLWKGKLTSLDAFEKLKVKSQMLADAIDQVADGQDMGAVKAIEIAAALVTTGNDLGP